MTHSNTEYMLQMVRSYKRKTNRGDDGLEALTTALYALSSGQSLKSVANEFKIPPRTLKRHRDAQVRRPGTLQLGPISQVLSDELEEDLVRTIQMMESKMFAFRTKDVRRLAFEAAEARGITHRFDKSSRMAGPDWLRGFLARHPHLSVKAPSHQTSSHYVLENVAKTGSNGVRTE